MYATSTESVLPYIDRWFQQDNPRCAYDFCIGTGRFASVVRAATKASVAGCTTRAGIDRSLYVAVDNCTPITAAGTLSAQRCDLWVLDHVLDLMPLPQAYNVMRLAGCAPRTVFVRTCVGLWFDTIEVAGLQQDVRPILPQEILSWPLELSHVRIFSIQGLEPRIYHELAPCLALSEPGSFVADLLFHYCC